MLLWLLASALTCAHLRRGIVNISGLSATSSRLYAEGVLVLALEAAQLDTAHCTSYLIGACWICLLGGFWGNFWCSVTVESTFLTTHMQNIFQIAV